MDAGGVVRFADRLVATGCGLGGEEIAQQAVAHCLVFGGDPREFLAEVLAEVAHRFAGVHRPSWPPVELPASTIAPGDWPTIPGEGQ